MRKFFQNFTADTLHTLLFAMLWAGMAWWAGDVLAGMLLAIAVALLLLLTAPLWILPMAVWYAWQELRGRR